MIDEKLPHSQRGLLPEENRAQGNEYSRPTPLSLARSCGSHVLSMDWTSQPGKTYSKFNKIQIVLSISVESTST